MFVPRKTLPRSNSSSSISSNSSVSSNTTVATNGSQSNGTALSTASDLSQWSANSAPRKRPQPKSPWPAGKPDGQIDFSRMPAGRPNGMVASHGPLQPGPGQPQMAPQQMVRMPPPEPQFPPGQPVLFLLSLNGTFERKTIPVPFAPDNVRIGRQTNMKMVPTPTNGFFDSKVLSRQHAEIFAERNGKVYIRDVKSSNGTFVNGTRLSQENRESEPHELQTGDHLELGIDIVSEDQKTVVHHKVAAKVEHSGFLNPSSNVLDMNFGDLDPANNAMMIPPGAMQLRGRAGSNASMASNGRMMPNGQGMNMQPNGMPSQRPFFLTPIATDQILKKLAAETRNARLQAQDLGRTSQFINTLLSKDDVRDMEKVEGPELVKPQPQLVNGLPFRPDPKTRFSEPPAPPPQQPLPEKPDVPSLKRGPTERAKPGMTAGSPIRQDNLSQIIQLTEALNNAKRDFDTQTARMRELEDMLQKEREARELAEKIAQQLEDSASATHMNGAPVPPAADPIEEAVVEEPETLAIDDVEELEVPVAIEQDDTAAKEAANALQTRIDTMEDQMRLLREQMEQWKQRCEVAEAERDADRKTLAEMVIQLREEEALRVAEQERARSRSRKRRAGSRGSNGGDKAPTAVPEAKDGEAIAQVDGAAPTKDASDEEMTLSRANTITPLNSRGPSTLQEHRLQAGMPYASMLGVVLIGMGLMAYINGWQSPPPRLER
jgi:hypothetical protein